MEPCALAGMGAGSGGVPRESSTPITCLCPWTLTHPPVSIQQTLGASCVRGRLPKQAGTGDLSQPGTTAQEAARAGLCSQRSGQHCLSWGWMAEAPTATGRG